MGSRSEYLFDPTFSLDNFELKRSILAVISGKTVYEKTIGFVIIGLTLYSAVIDRIKDYGTLKAIGASNGFIRKLILSQALIIGAAG